jgi:hypothetical protein
MRKHYRFILISLTICLWALIEPGMLYAQKTAQHDTSYFVTYPGTLTTRFFISRKYTTFILPASDNDQRFQYRANTKLNTGIGATFNNVSFNIAYALNFLNPDDEKGKSKSTDIQVHFYPKKWTIDVLGIFHNGLGLYTSTNFPFDTGRYYYRADVKQNIVGLSAFRVLNNNRFSYKAAMIQNEWQKKSAGTFLFGGQAFYGQIKADSALVRKYPVNGIPPATGISRLNFLSVGPGAGYAYTLVIRQHFFVTGSLIAGLNLNFSSEEGINGQKNKVAVNPGAVYKAAVGYNSSTWGISGTWAVNSLWINGGSDGQNYSVTTGNYMVILAKKIVIKKH